MTNSLKLCTGNGIAIIPTEAELAKSRRIVFLEGEISSEAAALFMRQIMQLNLEDDSKPIKVVIQSPGGLIQSGLAIYDIMQSSKAPIYTYVCDNAFSMAAILFIAGRKRYMFEHSLIMLHPPLVTQARGNVSSISHLSESMQESQMTLNEIVSKHSGRDIEDVVKDNDTENYYTAKEAVALNYCDGIVGLADLLKEESDYE